MTFLNPILALAALSCIAIPIVIHILMRKRRRPVEWGAMRFLIEAYQRQRKRLNLEQLLLLASRCLLVALLAMAVGKPILDASGAIGPRGPRTLYILLDNSLTASLAEDQNPSALERHKSTALKLVAELEQSRGDRVGLITLASPADATILPATGDLSGVAGVIRDLKPTDSKADFAGALEKLRDTRGDGSNKADEGNAYIALLSEFRVGSTDIDQSLSAFSGAATGTRIIAHRPASKIVGNVAITDVAPLETVLLAGSGERTLLPLRVALRRSGDTGAGVSKVRIEAMPPPRVSGSATEPTTTKAAEKVVTWKPGEEVASAMVTLDLAAGELGRSGAPVVVRATIDRDPIQRDGVFLRTIESRDRLAVALLAPPSAEVSSVSQFSAAQWLTLALAPLDDGTLRTRKAGDISITRLDPVRDLSDGVAQGVGPLAGFDAVLVPEPHLLSTVGWQRLRAAADAGAAVAVFPPAKEASHAWLDTFESTFGLDLDSPAEAKTLATPLRILPPPSDTSGLFAMLSGEFEELAKAVGVSRLLPVLPRGGSMSVALSAADGTPLVLTGLPARSASADTLSTNASPAGRGVIILVATALDLEWSDLPAKPLMVPLMQELVRQGVGLAASGRTGIAGQLVSIPSGTVELSPLAFSSAEADQLAAGSPIAVDSVRGPASPIRRAGLWKARASNGASLGIVAARADTAASRVEPRGEAEIASWIATLGASVEWLDDSKFGTPDENETNESRPAGGSILSAGPQKPPISFPLLIAAMIVAIAEVVMARLFSHARVDAGVIQDDAPSNSGGAAA